MSESPTKYDHLKQILASTWTTNTKKIGKIKIQIKIGNEQIIDINLIYRLMLKLVVIIIQILTPIGGTSSSPTTADLSSSTLAENDDELSFEISAFWIEDIGFISTLILGFLLSSSKIINGNEHLIFSNIYVGFYYLSYKCYHFLISIIRTRIIRRWAKITLMSIKIGPRVIFVNSNSRSIRWWFRISFIINFWSWWYWFLNFFTIRANCYGIFKVWKI